MLHTPIALYIHIPFCQTKCSYCNFNTYARLESLIPSYVAALRREIELWGESLGHPPVATVFFGGGTPSWVEAGSLATVLDGCRGAFRLQPAAEVTAEANPNDVTPARMRRWREIGVTRVSMGVQSFDDGLLRMLTRRHSASEAVRALQTVRDAGFDNVSIDLMYGLPRQSLALWRDTLEQAIRLSPPHVSLYALTIEEGTPLWKETREGRLRAPDPDLAADMYEAAQEMLAAAGYGHYEISNWARPGFECRHNLVYWRNGPFLGVGPGAHSYLRGERFWNIRSPADYVRRLTAGPNAASAIEERQRVSPAEELSQTLILGLRLAEGVSAAALSSRFGAEALALHLGALEHFRQAGLIAEEAGVFRLTSRGRLLSNEVFMRLLPA